MKAYSVDLRERVLAAVDAGTPHAGIVPIMRVSLATIGRYEQVRKRIEACGCRLAFLPAYSPDFSPIENALPKLKGFPRKVKALTQAAFGAAIAAGLATITSEDAHG